MIRKASNFTTPRSALALYGLMLVVPAAIFGVLYWKELELDQEERAARAPVDAANAATRVQGEIIRNLRGLMYGEKARPFYEYSTLYWDGPEDFGTPKPSPLTTEERPEGLLSWFTFPTDEAWDAVAEIYFGHNDEVALEEESKGHMRDLIQKWGVEDSASRGFSPINLLLQIDPKYPDGQIRETVPLSVAAMFLHPSTEMGCAVEDLQILMEAMPSKTIDVSTFDDRTILTQDETGALRLMGLRTVRMHAIGRNPEVDPHPPKCLSSIEENTTVVQGWVADGDWLLREQAQLVAEAQLSPNQRLFTQVEAAQLDPDQWVTAGFSVSHGLGIEFKDVPTEVANMVVAVDVSSLERRFRNQRLWFMGLVWVLGSSTLLGLRLLIGRVRSASEAARRTENFVASVTHELRTPLAAVKMYGEMLAAGWAATPEKQTEYAERIVGESNRLDKLVDRVLEKRRLSGAPPKRVSGDLNAAVQREIEVMGFEDDPSLTFELAPDLPAVLLTEEAVHSLLTNLVENAKKYAPVDTTDPSAEPILVRTRMHKGKVVLEVLDRGPGIPASERGQIFEAFYRVGSEATRTTQGTGLGLHLVAQYAKNLKGKARVLARDGGGSQFQVTFRTTG